MDINKLAIFDIETAGNWGTLDEMKKDNPKMAELWVKRCDFLRDRYDNNNELSCDELWVLKAGLHPEFARVVCVSFGVIRNGEMQIQSCSSTDEKEVLAWTATMLLNSNKLGLSLAGHTIERFDIPFLFKRFLANKMKPPFLINNWGKKPWDLTHFDVAKFWGNGAWQEGFTSLDTMTAVFGLDSPKESGVIASRVHATFWDDKNLASIEKYCELDVKATIEVIQALFETVNTVEEPVLA